MAVMEPPVAEARVVVVVLRLVLVPPATMGLVPMVDRPQQVAEMVVMGAPTQPLKAMVPMEVHLVVEEVVQSGPLRVPALEEQGGTAK